MADLRSFLEELRGLSVQPPAPEPDVDLKDVGLEEGDAAKFREEEDLRGGAVLKGVVEAGQGEERPREGDLVFIHYSLSDASGDVLLSTRAEHGGAGRPQPFVLGRGRRMLRGMELGIMEMARGERAVLDIQPAYAFLHADSGLPRPRGLRPEARVSADVTLTHWYRGGAGAEGGVKCVGEDGAAYLRTTREGQGWESPRPPFDVVLHATARLASTSGRQAEGGQPYFSTAGGEPLACSLGAGQLPSGVEAALGAMMRGHQAVLLCPLAQLRGGSLVPDPPDAEGGSGSGARGASAEAAPAYGEVELELLDFSQVRDMAGDGGVVKRIARKGRGEFPIDCPLEDSRVAVHLRVKPAGAAEWVWDSRGAGGQGPPLEFETGMGEVPEAVDMCVRLMLAGEVAALQAEARYAYEGRDDAPPGLPAGARCEFEIELASFERGPSLHTVAGGERLAAAARFKEQGNALFKQGKARLARQKYQKAVKALDRALDLERPDEVAQASALKASCLLNLARCAEREQEWGEALAWCNRALDEDDAYAKAYFRRAVLHGCLGDYAAAAADLAACAELDPEAAGECEREARRMERRAAEQEARQRSALKGFLDRA